MFKKNVFANVNISYVKMVCQWVTLLSHSKKVPGMNHIDSMLSLLYVKFLPMCVSEAKPFSAHTHIYTIIHAFFLFLKLIRPRGIVTTRVFLGSNPG